MVPDHSTLKGKRDYFTLSRLAGCALRRDELAMLEVETIQFGEAVGCWLPCAGSDLLAGSAAAS